MLTSPATIMYRVVDCIPTSLYRPPMRVQLIQPLLRNMKLLFELTYFLLNPKNLFINRGNAPANLQVVYPISLP